MTKKEERRGGARDGAGAPTKKLTERALNKSGRVGVKLSRPTREDIDVIAEMRHSTPDAAIAYAVERAYAGVKAEEEVRQVLFLIAQVLQQGVVSPELAEALQVQADTVKRLLPDLDQEPIFS